ncbi:kinase-like protein, partial [Clavulina sp. PMI_390]
DIDIDSANLKSLLRHRRDDLVRLCEVNEIETEGAATKKKLAQALLEWASTAGSASSSSSASTERDVPVTRRPTHHTAGRRRSQVLMPPPDPPLLFRDNLHISEVPATPPASNHAKEKTEDDIELDLDSLGLTDKEIKPEKIQKMEKIGSGGFKDVFLGKYHGRKVAIAEFRGQLSAMDIKELKLLREFNHPNVVKFYGVSIPADSRSTPVMIISELCPNGDLFDFIRNTPPPPLRSVLLMMRDIARGIEYLHLHTPSIIHRDCKSSNILITAKNTAKITDFGLAKVKQSTRSMVRSLVGTVNWQAPELWVPHPKYDYKVDVFSCAMVYWEMLQWHQTKKNYPWEGMNEHAIYDVVGRKGQRPSMHGMRKLWCPEIVELIEHMWQQDPRDRPTISHVVSELDSILTMY